MGDSEQAGSCTPVVTARSSGIDKTDKAAGPLRAGGPVAFPTEAVYGPGAGAQAEPDAGASAAVARR
ncbi:hypothetical protein AB0L35_36210 [Streptomyces sp. NPDC052309]|uniref:hypothetical protein n=1 Tax=Streptomyces sp. NPDC052309 TaxID=3155421 RepID=UPI0034496005